MKFRQINIERLREILAYDPDTGIFTWKKKTCDKVVVGTQAGCVATMRGARKYIVIRFDGNLHTSHRLAWAYYYGEQPPPTIDHDDGDGCHNWIKNLRKASQSQNLANMQKKIKSVTGYRGVYPYGTTGKRFEAKAMQDYKSVRFGIFDTPEAAYSAYCVGIKSLFGEFASVV